MIAPFKKVPSKYVYVPPFINWLLHDGDEIRKEIFECLEEDDMDVISKALDKLDLEGSKDSNKKS